MSEEKKDAILKRGVLIEFDFAVMPGHQMMLEVCKEQFAKEGLKIDQVIMARYMAGKSFVAGLSALCRAQEITSFEVSDMAASCNELFAEKIKANLKKVPAGFKDFIKAVTDKGMKVVIFSISDSEAIREAFADIPEESLGISEDLTSSFCFTSWEGWRRFARKNSLHERLCVSVCGSGLSVKGALTSGLSVIVKDNEMVDYQDISGYDKQIKEFDVGVVDEVARLLHLAG